MPQRHIGGVEL